MSYNIGVFVPLHPDFKKDGDEIMTVSSFVGPNAEKWVQISLGDKFIRLPPAYQTALLVMMQQSLEGTDSPITDLKEGGK